MDRERPVKVRRELIRREQADGDADQAATER